MTTKEQPVKNATVKKPAKRKAEPKPIQPKEPSIDMLMEDLTKVENTATELLKIYNGASYIRFLAKTMKSMKRRLASKQYKKT